MTTFTNYYSKRKSEEVRVGFENGVKQTTSL